MNVTMNTTRRKWKKELDAVAKAIKKNAKNFNEFQTDRLEQYVHYWIFQDSAEPNIILPEFTDPLATYDEYGNYNEDEKNDCGWNLYRLVYDGSDDSFREYCFVNMWVCQYLYLNTKYGKRYGTIE